MTLFLINKAAETPPPTVVFLPHAQVCGKPQPHMLMITIPVAFGNPISQDFYNNTIYSLQFHQLTCSCGHSACLTIHAYYDRSVKQDDQSVILHICRVKCSHCNATHALLPAFIVPYSQVSFPDQVDIISCFETSDNYSSVMEKSPSIDESCVRSVIRRYVKHWLQRLLSVPLSVSASNTFIHLCFSNFNRQFMQIKRTPNILFLTPT